MSSGPAVLTFFCGSCGETMRAPASLSGRKGRCAVCRAVVEIGTGLVADPPISPAEPAPTLAQVPTLPSIASPPAPPPGPPEPTAVPVAVPGGWSWARLAAGGSASFLGLGALGALAAYQSGAFKPATVRPGEPALEVVAAPVEPGPAPVEPGPAPVEPDRSWVQRVVPRLPGGFDDLAPAEDSFQAPPTEPLYSLGQPLPIGPTRPESARSLLTRRAQGILWLVQPGARLDSATELDCVETPDQFKLVYLFRYRTLRYHAISPDDVTKDLLLEFTFDRSTGYAGCRPMLATDDLVARPLDGRNNLSYHLASQVASFVARKTPPRDGAESPSTPRLGDEVVAWGEGGGDPRLGLHLFLKADEDHLFTMLGFAADSSARVDRETRRNLPNDVAVHTGEWRATVDSLLAAIRAGNPQALARCLGRRSHTIDLYDLTKGDKGAKMTNARRALWDAARHVEMTDDDLRVLLGWLGGFTIQDADRHDDEDEIEVNLVQRTARNEYRDYIFLHRSDDNWLVRDIYAPRSKSRAAASDPKGPKGIDINDGDSENAPD
jgi:hypothetical protein